jgi:hypothetical protein
MKLIGIQSDLGHRMKIFNKKSKTVRELTRVQRRVKSLPTPELLTWTDQIMYSVGRNLSSWQKTQHKDNLSEARLGAESLSAILDTLSERHGQ